MNPVPHKLNKRLAGCVKKTVGHLGVLGLQVANCSAWRLCVVQNLCSVTGGLVNAFCSKNFTCNFVR